MKYAFILNPAANNHKNQGRGLRLEATIRSRYPNAHISCSERSGDITLQVQNLSGTHDVVIVCGGDGSVNELVQGLRGTDCIGGVIPSGSGNDFSRGIGLSLNPDAELEKLSERKIVGMDSVDVVVDGKRHMFQNTLGIGFDGWANHFATLISFPKGKLKYVVAALKSVMHHKPQNFEIVIDGKQESVKALMITLANGGIEGGGFHIAPNARPDDGLLDVVIVKPVGKLGLILRLPFLLFRKQPAFRALEHRRCRHIHIQCHEGMAAHADGENLGLRLTSIDATLVHQSARFLVPERFGR